MAVRAHDGLAVGDVSTGRFGKWTRRVAGPTAVVLVGLLALLVVTQLCLGTAWSSNQVSGFSDSHLAVVATVRSSLDATKKGVCVWSFRGVSAALNNSGATWYLTWSTRHQGIIAPRGVQFVPMVRSAANVTPSALSQAEQSGSALLTFNEPDLGSQADMTVAQALSLWPRLMGTNLQLSSPAVATGATTPGGWLDRFMNGAKRRHYRVDFIAVHWYGADFHTAAAVAQLKSFLRKVYGRYNLPIWLTEYALIDFSPTGPIYPTSKAQAAFASASVKMLDSLGFVKRYAWFALPAPSSGPSSGLYAPGPRATSAGLAFARA